MKKLSNDYYRRVNGILRPEKLQGKHVLLVGCGSGGSRAADELIRTGIGRKTLIDLPGETVELHNIVRHVLGFASLGKPKVTELRDYLLNLRPDAHIDAVEMNVAEEVDRLADLVMDEAVDLLILGTDNDPSRYAVNAVALATGVPMVYGAVFDGGVGGEAGRYHPEWWPACYGCMVLHIGRGFQPVKEINIDYSNVEQSAREARAASALNMDISTIANLVARLSLYTLLHEETPELDDIPGNYVLFANRLAGGVFQRSLHADFYSLTPHPDCLLCASRETPDADLLAFAAI